VIGPVTVAGYENSARETMGQPYLPDLTKTVALIEVTSLVVCLAVATIKVLEGDILLALVAGIANILFREAELCLLHNPIR